MCGGGREGGGVDPLVGKTPGGERGNPLQYSCLENSMNREAWRETVYEVSKSWTWLKWLSTSYMCISWAIKWSRSYFLELILFTKLKKKRKWSVSNFYSSCQRCISYFNSCSLSQWYHQNILLLLLSKLHRLLYKWYMNSQKLFLVKLLRWEILVTF